jgi:hypothetical protein
MADFYAMMIIKGARKFEQCPDPLKAQVKDRLNTLDAGYLVTE